VFVRCSQDKHATNPCSQKYKISSFSGGKCSHCPKEIKMVRFYYNI
jgi:hypothetical protein